MRSDADKPLKRHLPLKEALFLGFCAVFIVFTRTAFRLRLRIPGRNMFFTLFFLMLARGCVPYRFSASFVGLLSGAMRMVLGLGRGGPLLLVRSVLPAFVIDVAAMVMPVLFQSYALCMVVSTVAASTRMIEIFIFDYLIGMDDSIILQSVLLEGLGNVLFGMAGSLLIPPVIRKLKAYGVI